MKFNYIAIEREYGSGGTKIARLLAEECGLPFYGKEILEEVSQKYDVSIERIQNYEETVTNSVRRSFFTLGQVHSADPSMLTKEDYIFVAEQTVIRDLAANGPAVFLGHCASEALDPSKGVARVFIRCTDEAEKKKRIMTDYDIPESEVDAVRKRYDKKRANYYYANTSHRWTDLTNYDVVLDSSALGIEGCVRVLKGLLPDRVKKKNPQQETA